MKKLLIFVVLAFIASFAAAGDERRRRRPPSWQPSGDQQPAPIIVGPPGGWPPPGYTPLPPPTDTPTTTHDSRVIYESHGGQVVNERWKPPSDVYTPWKPPPREPGPERMPVMVDFPDVYEAVVRSYIKEQSEKQGGAFLVKDDSTGHVYSLKPKRIAKDKIVQPSSKEAFACLDFVSNTGEKLDLDFYVAKQGPGEWAVAKIYLHKIDGVARFVYNADYKPVSPDAAAQAAQARPAPAAAKGIPKPKQPAKLTTQVSFREPSGNDMLDGGEKAKLSVSVFNAGPGPAYAVRVAPTLESKSALSLPASVELGELKAGQTLTGEVSVEAPESVASGKVKLRLETKEGNGFDAEPVLVEFETRTYKPPKLEVAGVSIGPGKVVQAGEPTKVSVAVRNAGPGPAEAVAAFLVVSSPDIFISGEPSVSLGALKAGQAKMAEFELFVNKRYKSDGSLPVSVSLSESRGKYGVSQASLRLALGKAPPAMKVLAVKGKEAELAVETAPAVEDVDLPPQARTAADPEAYAVLIGIEKYRDLPSVDYANRDAETMHTYLTRSMGFDPRNVVILSDERATLTDMATYLGPWLEDRVAADSKVFIYFAGHGAPDSKTGRSYLIPYDGNPSYVETKAYAVQRLYENLAKLPSRDVTVVLDACFSGAGGRSVIAKGARPLVIMATTPAAGANMAVISAASSDQISTYYPEAQHGMLTYFLLKGLRGSADLDADKNVTTAELYGYLRPAVEREARKQHVEQTPTISPEPGLLGAKGSRVWVRLR